MSTLSNKFVITKGLDNEFIITIKQNDSTLPMIITGTDTFSCVLFNRDTDTEVGRVSLISNSNGVITVYNASNGKIKIKLNSVFVNNLVKDRGPKEDKYYLKPTYRMDLDCVTTNNGSFVAKIHDIYVD